ncbi:recombinase family protein [Streptomyces sp. NBC_00878]|uniref:recombinase family protein n=1 Tax=Streptomyces sp. NBC_00878 TaxID=2975854 RepID=UPI00339062E4
MSFAFADRSSTEDQQDPETSPRYTGYQVWNRQRKEELQIDVDDVALGHRTQQTWNKKGAWIHSDNQSHTPLVSAAVFTQVQDETATPWSSLGPRGHVHQASVRGEGRLRPWRWCTGST